MADVFLHRLAEDAADLGAPDLRAPLRTLAGRLGLATGPRARSWGLKVEVGPRGRPPTVDPAWAAGVAGALNAPGGSFCFDTLSITTRGLEEDQAHRDAARDKGYGAALDGPPFVVADGPDQGEGPAEALPGSGEQVRIAAAVAAADGLAILSAPRPHPHLGFRGAVANLGLGAVDRASKIALHRDIRPTVDTPLCAGCGSCLEVCLFDAIILTSGRAYIDHKLCTGCGECMTVCFMAGIETEAADGVRLFQRRVAGSAAAVRRAVTGGETGRLAFFNFLVGIGGQESGARRRRNRNPGTIGVVASADPVACDQATWDLVAERLGGPLKDWTGYGQEPEELLGRAGDLGLGDRRYRLVGI